MVFTVSQGVVLGTAWCQFLHLPATKPRPFLPELRVELGQDGGIVFDLCKRIISGQSLFCTATKGALSLTAKSMVKSNITETSACCLKYTQATRHTLFCSCDTLHDRRVHFHTCIPRQLTVKFSSKLFSWCKRKVKQQGLWKWRRLLRNLTKVWHQMHVRGLWRWKVRQQFTIGLWPCDLLLFCRNTEDSLTVFYALNPQTPAVVTWSENIQGVCVIHNLQKHTKQKQWAYIWRMCTQTMLWGKLKVTKSHRNYSAFKVWR